MPIVTVHKHLKFQHTNLFDVFEQENLKRNVTGEEEHGIVLRRKLNDIMLRRWLAGAVI